MYTIGQLARRVGMPTSTLRYYEKVGLLEPSDRTEAGYRLYDKDAEHVLTFIHRAQRLGFSLSDIRHFLTGMQDGGLLDQTVADIAERRYLEIERQLTDWRVLQHELGLFLTDFRRRMTEGKISPAAGLFDRLVDRVCGGHGDELESAASLSWLLEKTGCNLAGIERQEVVSGLSGQHFHIWRTDDGYSILAPGHDPKIEQALRKIAAIEADCHAHPKPQLTTQKEGTLFTVRGDQAFLFAEFFLSIELDTAT